MSIILSTNFEVRTRVIANWADFRGDVANVNMTTVAAFPDGDFVALEDNIVLDVVKKFEIAIFVFFFDGGDSFEFVGNLVVTFGAGIFGELFIHVGPFVIFTSGGGF